MQGYFKEKDANETVIFDAFYRNNPVWKRLLPSAPALEQVIEYIKNLHFDEEDIDYLRTTGLFEEDFLDYLSRFPFQRRYLRHSGRNRRIPKGTACKGHRPDHGGTAC